MEKWVVCLLLLCLSMLCSPSGFCLLGCCEQFGQATRLFLFVWFCFPFKKYASQKPGFCRKNSCIPRLCSKVSSQFERSIDGKILAGNVPFVFQFVHLAFATYQRRAHFVIQRARSNASCKRKQFKTCLNTKRWTRYFCMWGSRQS